MRERRGAQRVIGIGMAVALAACAEAGPQVPWTSRPVEVKSVVPRAVYRDAVLVGDGFSRRLFFADTQTCPALVVEGARVRYAQHGPWGELRTEDQYCVPSGIGSLKQWRDARGRPGSRVTVPRARAQYRIVFTDDEVALARGRFPLAGYIGWRGVEDTIAVIPRSEACKEPLDRGVATMEYRLTGEHPFTLVSANGICPIEGFILPVPGI